MNVDDIPQELIDILDDRAGKKHSRSGSVVSCLAEILTKWEDIKRDQVSNRLEELPEVRHVRGECPCPVHVCGKASNLVTTKHGDEETSPRKTKKIPPNNL